MKKLIDPALSPLTGKYAQLRDDLKKALSAGRAAEDAAPKDDSFWNWDCVSIVLPRWNIEEVKQAAKEAGTFCARSGSKWVFAPISRSRGTPSVLNVEAMSASLRSMGYNAAVYGLKK